MRRAPRDVFLGAFAGALPGALRGWQGMVIGAAIGAVGGAVTSMLTVPECPPRNKPLLLIGDSLAMGLAPHIGKLAESCGLVRFGALVQEGDSVLNWGEARWKQALALVDKSIAGGAVVVSLGGNDFQTTAPDRVQAAMDELVGRIHGAGAKLMWIEPPAMPIEDKANIRQRWMRLVGFQPFRDFYPTAEVRYPVSADKIHPTPRGYTELAPAIWQWLAWRLS